MYVNNVWKFSYLKKFVYASWQYYIAASQTSNLNNSGESEKNCENIFGGLSGPQMEFEKKEVKNLVTVSL
jgi:hypothetical protein